MEKNIKTLGIIKASSDNQSYYQELSKRYRNYKETREMVVGLGQLFFITILSSGVVIPALFYPAFFIKEIIVSLLAIMIPLLISNLSEIAELKKKKTKFDNFLIRLKRMMFKEIESIEKTLNKTVDKIAINISDKKDSKLGPKFYLDYLKYSILKENTIKLITFENKVDPNLYDLTINGDVVFPTSIPFNMDPALKATDQGVNLFNEDETKGLLKDLKQKVFIQEQQKNLLQSEFGNKNPGVLEKIGICKANAAIETAMEQYYQALDEHSPQEEEPKTHARVYTKVPGKLEIKITND